MALSKDEQREHAQQYFIHFDRALAAEQARDYSAAIRHAQAALPFASGMMQFQEMVNDAEFESVGAIDLILRLAPPLFDTDVLDVLELLLKEQRRIAKRTDVNEKAQLGAARDEILLAHDLWNVLERMPGSCLTKLAEQLNKSVDCISHSLGVWANAGVVRIINPGEGAVYEFENPTERIAIAKCASCGASCKGEKWKFLSRQACPQCSVASEFVVVGYPNSFVEER